MSERVKPRGFTWVELLVVVAIIAILVALFFPVFARTTCYTTYCGDHLRELGEAAAMYAADHDSRYPPAGLSCLDPASPNGSPGCLSGALVRESYDDEERRQSSRYGYAETWQGGGLVALQPYFKQWDNCWCIFQRQRPPLPTDPRSFYAGFEWLRSPARVRYPGEKVLMLDAYSHGKTPVRFDEAAPGSPRHTVLFVDGHAKSMDLSTGCSGSPSPRCKGWESCMGPGGNRNYVCSGHGNGVNVPDFPW